MLQESSNPTLVEAFQLQAERHPNRLAVCSFDDGQYSYRELDHAAARIANTILARLGPGSEPVPQLMTQGAGFMPAMLGVMKAGKIFCPLDTSSPPARLGGIVQDLEARLLLTDEAHAALAGSIEARLVLNVADRDALAETDSEPAARPGADDLAWISWTSGSTGKPKGVTQSHRRAVRMIHDYAKLTGLTAGDRVSLFHPNLTWDIFGALLTGASIQPLDVRRHGSEAVRDWTLARDLTVFRAFPTTFRSVVAALGETRFPSVRLLHLSGETVTPGDVSSFRRHFPRDCSLMVLYGSTEGGLGTANFIVPSDPAGDRVSIGRPVDGIDIRVLNEAGEPCAPGEIGEIAIRSPHVFPGYWRRPDLTEAAFLQSAKAVGSERVFLTGDLGSVRQDGQFDHAGRKDGQVKVRGFRLELAEIEQALQAHPGIRMAAAKVIDDQASGVQKLIAYYVPSGEGPSDSALRRFLQERLPEPAHPDRFIRLPTMPMTSNGKTDRRALPPPDRQRPEIDTLFVAPGTPLEEEVAQVFGEFLGIENVGSEDSFFELGGKSLAAFRVLTTVATKYQVVIPPRKFFEAPTVAATARYIMEHALSAASEDAVEKLLAEIEALKGAPAAMSASGAIILPGG